MPNATRFYPDEFVHPEQCFNILVLSEGYRSKSQFVRDCEELRDRLFSVTPFNQTWANPTWLSMHHYYITSTQNGPAIDTTPTAGATPFGSRYDSTTKTLTVDNAKVQAALLSLEFLGNYYDPDLNGLMYPGPITQGKQRVTVIILLPSLTGHPAGADMQYLATAQPTHFEYFATTKDGEWEQAVARAVGHSLGLAFENESYGSGYQEPDAPTADFITLVHPNLVVIPTIAGSTFTVPADFRWKPYLPAGATTLAVFPHPAPTSQPNFTLPSTMQTYRDIVLHEGGGGYRTKVYRSAADCLMRRRAGETPLPIRAKQVPFCPVCRKFLTEFITGTSTERKRPVRRLKNQSLKYDAEFWKTQLPVTLPATLTVTGRPSGYATGPYWEYEVVANDTVGLRIRNANIQNTVYRSTSFEEVLEQLDVPEIMVTFDDGATLPFDVKKAFTNNKVELWTAEDGTDNLQRGVKMQLEDDFGGRAKVTVMIGIVFRDDGEDFDPGGAFNGMKLYPEVALRWARGGSSKVTGFRATVRLILIPDLVMSGHGGHGGATTPANTLSLFTDSNTQPGAGKDSRELRTNQAAPTDWSIGGYMVAPPSPDWGVIFDYVMPDLTKEYEFTGVYGPADPATDPTRHTKHTTTREETYTWPVGSTHNFHVKKVPRQGDFDNMHVHHYLGIDAAGVTMVSAPFCGMGCLHLHWRWGEVTPRVAGGAFGNGRPELYRGWGNDPATAEAASTSMAPLIPPNQHLRIAITAPGHTRFDNDNVVNLAAAQTLDGKRKEFWYVAEVTAPLPSNQQQVIFEHGLGYALDYSAAFKGNILKFLNDVIDPDMAQPTTEAQFDVLYHRLYNEIRYFYDDENLTNPRPQNPSASYDEGGTKTSPEKL